MSQSRKLWVCGVSALSFLGTLFSPAVGIADDRSSSDHVPGDLVSHSYGEALEDSLGTCKRKKKSKGRSKFILPNDEGNLIIVPENYPEDKKKVKLKTKKKVSVKRKIVIQAKVLKDKSKGVDHSKEKSKETSSTPKVKPVSQKKIVARAPSVSRSGSVSGSGVFTVGLLGLGLINNQRIQLNAPFQVDAPFDAIFYSVGGGLYVGGFYQHPFGGGHSLLLGGTASAHYSNGGFSSATPSTLLYTSSLSAIHTVFSGGSLQIAYKYASSKALAVMPYVSAGGGYIFSQKSFVVDGQGNYIDGIENAHLPVLTWGGGVNVVLPTKLPVTIGLDGTFGYGFLRTGQDSGSGLSLLLNDDRLKVQLSVMGGILLGKSQ